MSNNSYHHPPPAPWRFHRPYVLPMRIFVRARKRHFLPHGSPTSARRSAISLPIFSPNLLSSVWCSDIYTTWLTPPHKRGEYLLIHGEAIFIVVERQHKCLFPLEKCLFWLALLLQPERMFLTPIWCTIEPPFSVTTWFTHPPYWRQKEEIPSRWLSLAFLWSSLQETLTLVSIDILYTTKCILYGPLPSCVDASFECSSSMTIIGLKHLHVWRNSLLLLRLTLLTFISFSPYGGAFVCFSAPLVYRTPLKDIVNDTTTGSSYVASPFHSITTCIVRLPPAVIPFVYLCFFNIL